MVGAYDPRFRRKVNPTTGEVSDSGQTLSAEVLGATFDR